MDLAPPVATPPVDWFTWDQAHCCSVMHTHSLCMKVSLCMNHVSTRSHAAIDKLCHTVSIASFPTTVTVVTIYESCHYTQSCHCVTVSLCPCTLHKPEYLLVLVLCLRLLDNVNLVLEDDDVFQLHDLNGREVLRRLRLGTGFIPS